VTIYIPPSGVVQVAPSDLDRRQAARLRRSVQNGEGMTRSRHKAVAATQDEAWRRRRTEPCGCHSRFRCAWHWSLMSPQERREFAASNQDEDSA
jgi:hypothetical protein